MLAGDWILNNEVTVVADVKLITAVLVNGALLVMKTSEGNINICKR